MDPLGSRDHHSTGSFSSQSSVGPYLPLPPYNTDQDEHDDDMFSLASGLYTQYFSPQQINLLVVGVQGAGKTTCLERIKVTDFPSKSSSYSTTAVAPLTVEAALSIQTSSTTSTTLEEHEPLHHHSSTHRKKDTGGAKPELLRTKIFLSENPHDFDAPPRRTHRPRRRRAGTGTDEQQPPASRFAWICPPAPSSVWVRAANAGASKMDLSDHERDDDDDYDDPDGIDGDDWSEGQWTTGHRGADDDDDDATNCSLRSVLSEDPSQSQPARSRTMVRSNTLPEQPQQHHELLHGGGPVGLPAPRRLSLKSSGGGGRMESIDLGGPPPPPPPRRSAAAAATPQEEHSHTNDTSSSLPPLPPLPHQYDLKPGAKMLPLEKIRPTIGMNLAKTQVCGAQVHVFDVSGKLQNLWERYYADADAVLFVWKLERNDDDDDDPSHRGNDDDDDSERPTATVVTPEQQKRVLEQVRSAVADDIPFVVLGHLFQPDPPYNCEPDVLYSTSQLLPHYHNPYQALFVGNAVTGQGLKTCLEWLIGAAKRQKRIRERQADDRIMMKH